MSASLNRLRAKKRSYAHGLDVLGDADTTNLVASLASEAIKSGGNYYAQRQAADAAKAKADAEAAKNKPMMDAQKAAQDAALKAQMAAADASGAEMKAQAAAAAKSPDADLLAAKAKIARKAADEAMADAKVAAMKAAAYGAPAAPPSPPSDADKMAARAALEADKKRIQEDEGGIFSLRNILIGVGTLGAGLIGWKVYKNRASK